MHRIKKIYWKPRPVMLHLEHDGCGCFFVEKGKEPSPVNVCSFKSGLQNGG